MSTLLTLPKFKGGERFNPTKWNAALAEIQRVLNGLTGDNFREDAEIDQSKFTATYITALEKSIHGGNNKVLEHDGNGNISLHGEDAQTSKKIIMDANNFIKFDFFNNEIQFTLNNVQSVFIDTGGWN